MPELMTVSIGLGLVLSLLFSELFALVAGGMVVPGYMALSLHDPYAIFATLLIALLAWLVVGALGQYVILYGRRRTVLMILVGFVLNAIFLRYVSSQIRMEDESFAAVGHIVPGLIAIWFERQGAVATTATLLIAIVTVRLGLLLVYGPELTI